MNNIEELIDRVRRMVVSDREANLAADLLAACRAAGFIDDDGKVRKVIRRVDVGRQTSDYVDPVIDVMDAGVTVFVCEAALAAKEAK